jgi:outer membrane lipoprotein-sorting protein
MKKSQLRWVPALVVPAVVIAGAVAIPSMANADVQLPTKSAAGIVALAEKSAGTSFSGSVTQTADLGLPQVPTSALGSSAKAGVDSVLAQLTGTHKAKVYVSGTKASRIQTLDDLAERDVTRNGDSVWAYDSKANTALHLTLPSGSSAQAAPSTATLPTPTEVAQKALDAIGSYTTVETSSNVMVAGQKAYQITLTPKDTKTLVGRVTLAVDATTGVPLKAVIDAKGQSAPAYSVAFTSIDYSTPSADTFAFTPPKGAKVTDKTVPSTPSHAKHPGALSQGDATRNAEHKAAEKSARPQERPTLIGSGWSSVVAATLPTGAVSSLTQGSGSSSQILDQVLKPVAGGKIVQTSLLTVFLADSGKVYVGSVSAADLEAAVAAQK